MCQIIIIYYKCYKHGNIYMTFYFVNMSVPMFNRLSTQLMYISRDFHWLKIVPSIAIPALSFLSPVGDRAAITRQGCYCDSAVRQCKAIFACPKRRLKGTSSPQSYEQFTIITTWVSYDSYSPVYFVLPGENVGRYITYTSLVRRKTQ